MQTKNRESLDQDLKVHPRETKRQSIDREKKAESELKNQNQKNPHR